MVHDVEVGTPISDVDGVIGSDLVLAFQFFNHRDLPVTGGCSQDV